MGLWVTERQEGESGCSNHCARGGGQGLGATPGAHGAGY